MAEGPLVDRLDRAIEAILARQDATAALADAELAPLAVVAAELRHCPGAGFKARLGANLKRRATMTTTTAALVTTGIREGFTTITPYVSVSGPGLVDFLARVFGAEETSRAEGPSGVHREVRIGNSMIMIGEGRPGLDVPTWSTAFHVYVADVDAAFERAIAAGGASMGAPEDRPYGERSGFVKDAFGNHWYIATHLGPTPVPEGRRTVTPFLHPRGVPVYIDFLKSAFGAIEEARHQTPEGGVLHAALRIGDAAIEMGESQGAALPMPSGFYLYVAEPDALYEQAIAAGAKSLSAPADQWYGDRMASVEDPIGNRWFIARPA